MFDLQKARVRFYHIAYGILVHNVSNRFMSAGGMRDSTVINCSHFFHFFVKKCFATSFNDGADILRVYLGYVIENISNSSLPICRCAIKSKK